VKTNAALRVALSASLLSVWLAGCMVGPNYKRPEVSAPAQFRAQAHPPESNSLADLPWWQVFSDKALQGLIVQSLNGNYDLQVAVTRIEQARANVASVRSGLFPQIGYDVGASRQEVFNPLQTSHNIVYNAVGWTLNAAWEADIWGRVRRATESARATLFAQEDVRRGVRLSLVSDVAANYFSLIELDRQLVIAQQSSRAYKQILDLFTNRFNAGRDSRLAVERAQAAYDSSNASIASVTRAIGQQENILSVLLGAYPRDIERGSVLTAQTMPPTPVGQSTELLRRRPDIQQAENVMISANAQIGVAIASFYPRIGLSALFGGQAPHIDHIFDSSFRVWSIGAGLTGPIFQGGQLRANYQQSKAFWDETIAQYRGTVINAFRETSDALVAQQTLVGERGALESQVNALQRSVDLSVQRYDDGRASYFEVLEAEQLLFAAQVELAQTQRDQLLAVVNLYKALGGGWNLNEASWSNPQGNPQ